MSAVAIRARASETARQFDARVLGSFDELEQIRSLWNQVEWAGPDADLDFFLAVASSRPDVERPFVLLINRGESLVAMVVARVERIPFASRIGHKVVHSPLVRSITVVPDGVHGAED